MAPVCPEKKLRPTILAVLAVSLFLNLYGIWWGLPSYRGWATDELVPAKVFKGILNGFSYGAVYPPFHYYLLTILYSPLALLHLLHITDVRSLPTYTVLFYAGRCLSVLMGTGIVLLVYLCGQEINEQKSSVLAALITALICPFTYYSKITNLDVPYLFWIMLSLLFYIRILKNHRLKDYLSFVTSAVLAICTKDQAYGFYVLTPVAILVSYLQHRKKSGPGAKLIDCILDRRIWLSLCLAVTLFAVIHQIPFRPARLLQHVRFITGPEREVQRGRDELFYRNVAGEFRMLWQTLCNIKFAFGWPVFLVCLLGLLRAFLKADKHSLLLWLSIPFLSYTLFFLCVVPTNYVRFSLPLCVILSFFGARLFAEFLNDSFYRLAIILGIFVYTFAYSFSLDLLMSKDSRYYGESWLKENVDQGATVVGVSRRHFLPRLEKGEELPSLASSEPDSGSTGEAYQFGLGSHTKIIEPTTPDLAETVAEAKPDFIITSFDEGWYDNTTKAHGFFADLGNGKSGYRLASRFRFGPKWYLLNYGGLLDNMMMLNPEIKIFRKN